MVSVSPPDGTCLDTLYNSIMKPFLLSVIFVGGLVLAGCREQPPAASPPPSSSPASPSKSVPKIVAFGDSLTAGLGLPQSENYPALLGKRLEADGFEYEIV